ncbi:MAG: 23S rRNA (adenine(2030)-N(6))-methyltransferase RlmJ [Thioalkalivibrionaceae bacterium]
MIGFARQPERRCSHVGPLGDPLPVVLIESQSPDCNGRRGEYAMLSYQHEYHVGNFADLHKHLVLFAVLESLSRKPKPWTAVDLFAGSGWYQLDSQAGREARAAMPGVRAPIVRSAEWRRGYGCLRGDLASDPLLARFQSRIGSVSMGGLRAGSYQSGESFAVTSDSRVTAQSDPNVENDSSELQCGGPPQSGGRCDWGGLPGSPAWIMAALRETDQALFCEWHPQAYQALRDWTRAMHNSRDRGGATDSKGYRNGGAVAVHRRDAREAVNGLMPPRVRRGVVVIDPPYERLEEYSETTQIVAAARSRWPEACVLLWSPRLHDDERDRLAAGLVDAVVRHERRARRAGGESAATLCSRLELDVESGLRGSTVALLNAPFRIELDLRGALNEMVDRLRGYPGGAVADDSGEGSIRHALDAGG